MSEICLQGLAASPGILVGALVPLATPVGAALRMAADSSTEIAALRQAIDRSIGELTELAARVENEAAAILSFQIAMLEDDALSGPACRDIERGIAADRAWMNALESQVNEYEAASDEYFRARAADLIDLRDRVLRRLTGVADAPPVPEGTILVADDLAPSRFLSMDWSAGGAVALTRGSPTSHVAMLARSRGVPMVVGLGQDLLRWADQPSGSSTAALDGARGLIIVEPGAERRAELLSMKARDDSARRWPPRIATGRP
jgi:phosphotransferase system enzyme I (PtsI)